MNGALDLFEDYAEDEARERRFRKSQKARVLAMLREGPKTNVDFIHAGIPNFRSRLSELRDIKRVVTEMGIITKDGYDITEGERVTEGVYIYHLRSKP